MGAFGEEVSTGVEKRQEVKGRRLEKVLLLLTEL